MLLLLIQVLLIEMLLIEMLFLQMPLLFESQPLLEMLMRCIRFPAGARARCMAGRVDPDARARPLALRVRECRSKRRGRRDRGEEEARVRHRDGDPWRVCAVRYRRFSLIRGSVGGAGVRWASIVVSWALGAAESSGGVDGVVVSTTKARWCR